MNRIRNKIALAVAGGIFVTLLPLTVVVVRWLETQALTDLKHEASITAGFLSEAVSASVDLDDGESVQQALKIATSRPHILFIEVYNLHQELLASYQVFQPKRLSIPKQATEPQTFNPVAGVVLAVHPILSPIDPEDRIGTFALGLSTQSLNERTRQFRLVGGGISLILFLVGNLIAWLIGMNIARPVTQLAVVARQIANGDLSQSVRLDNFPNDEIGKLAQAFDNMRASLHAILAHIRDAGLRMHSSTDEIFMAVNQLTAALEQQSASVHETTMTMESFTTTSRQISGNTATVVKMAEQTNTLSQKGTTVAEETIRKMQDIHVTNQVFLQKLTTLGERSEKIGNVIQIIHDIADRTKLIAFNAALEAVGAKDLAGKRFNVVAVEIRRLADTIIESTQEIETNILEIQQWVRELVSTSGLTTQRIADGQHQTETTADWLREIVDAAIQTNDEAKQIALIIHEQQFANEQILSAMKELSNGTRQIVDASNQVSTSASAMRQLAETFQEFMNKFELERPSAKSDVRHPND